MRGAASQRDFVLENFREAVAAVPPKEAPSPKFTEREDYGKTPAYILQRKDEERQFAVMQRTARAQAEQGAFTRVSDDERAAILAGLRANHASVYREFSGLSVMVDTKAKKDRKLGLEHRLSELEADIARIEAHPVILIQ